MFASCYIIRCTCYTRCCYWNSICYITVTSSVTWVVTLDYSVDIGLDWPTEWPHNLLSCPIRYLWIGRGHTTQVGGIEERIGGRGIRGEESISWRWVHLWGGRSISGVHPSHDVHLSDFACRGRILQDSLIRTHGYFVLALSVGVGSCGVGGLELAVWSWCWEPLICRSSFELNVM